MNWKLKTFSYCAIKFFFGIANRSERFLGKITTVYNDLYRKKNQLLNTWQDGELEGYRR